VRGEAYDKAADAVNALRSEVADVPPSVIEEIIRKSTARVTAKKAPRLFAQYRVAQVQVSAAKEVSAAKAALAKKPNDAGLMRKLAEAQALSGDWKAALESFAKQGTKAGATAKSESEGKGLPDVADFWWAYESYLGEEDADIFKMHAAEIYRKCLADGSIDGLKKNIVEKRLKQVVAEGVANGTATKKGLENFAIDIGSGEKIEFVACPAGTFTMGYEDEQGPYQRHKVTISRPFWISKYLITMDQWRALTGKEDVRVLQQRARKEPWTCDILGGGKTPAFGSYDDYVDFMKRLEGVSKKRLPKGYVFRFPSEAEWEYACKANGKEGDLYCKMKWTDEECARLFVPWKDRRRMMKQKGVKDDNLDRVEKSPFVIPPMAAGSCEPNGWGIYDMIGRHQFTLDTVPMREIPFPGFKIPPVTYDVDKTVVDPLIVCDEDVKIGHIVCGDGWLGMPAWGKPVCLFKSVTGTMKMFAEMSLRIVVGPDLVSEWKAKHGKK